MKTLKNTTYSVSRCTWANPAAEFFTFHLKLPQFHQLPTVYIITLRRVIWLFPEEKELLLLPLISWNPSSVLVCDSGCLFSQTGKETSQRSFWSPSFKMELDWTELNGRDNYPPTTESTYEQGLSSSFLSVLPANFPKSYVIWSPKTQFLGGHAMYSINQENTQIEEIYSILLQRIFFLCLLSMPHVLNFAVEEDIAHSECLPTITSSHILSCSEWVGCAALPVCCITWIHRVSEDWMLCLKRL